MSDEEKRAIPAWQKASEDLVRLFNAAVGPMPGVEVRKMFGYPSAFFNGQMFAGLYQDSMIVRLGPKERSRLLEVPGASVFEPMAGRPMREYVVVPPAIRNAPDELSGWLEKSLSYAASLGPKLTKAKAGRGKKASEPESEA